MVMAPKKLIKKPRISVVMVDGSFRESFHSVDFFGNQTFPKDEYELLWVEYYDKVNPYLAEKISKYSNFQIITLKRGGGYHSSYCFNAGILGSQGELLVIPDADQVVESNFLEIVYKVHQTDDKLAMYICRYDEPKEKHIQKIAIERLRKACLLKNPQNYGGCLTVRKKWLLEINGYEQHPIFGTGDHANGRDVYTRLKNLGLQIMWHPELKLFHPWHPETLRAAPMHKVQQVFINYRSLSLDRLPFQGIDSTKNSEPPKHLAAEIKDAPMKYSDKSMELKKPGWRVRKFLRRIPALPSLARFIRKVI